MHIEGCLRSLLKVADEVIVVDSYSTDDTPTICKRMGVKLVQHEYIGQIEQKNYALSLAKHEIILALDGDEELSDELIESINELKASGFDQSGFLMNRLTNYAGKWVRHGGWYPDWKLRLWKKDRALWGGQNPHDQVKLLTNEKPIKLKGHILHYAFDTIADHDRRISEYAKIGAQSSLESGQRATALHPPIAAIWKFVRDYFLKAGFLDGITGFHIARLSATSKYLKYKYLLQLQKQLK